MARTDDPPTNVVYRLLPGAGDAEALSALLAAYRRMFGILAEIRARNGLRANVVELTRLAYDRVRAETHLPSRYVTLGIRDYAQHLDVAPEAITTIPLDEKLYAIKGPSEVSVTTLDGRRTFAYRVEGYVPAVHEVSPARLTVAGDTLTLHAGVAVPATTAETRTMADTILTRVGRLIAGFSNAALDSVEGRDRLVVAEQALREIDGVIEEARAGVGRIESERYRADQRRQQLEKDLEDLKLKIGTALDQNREDLARPAVARILDIETQISALVVTLADIDERLQTERDALNAALATRRDAELRVQTLRNPKQARPDLAGYDRGPNEAAQRERKLEGSLRAIDRATGLQTLKGGESIEELENLHRQSEIDKRLAELKQGRPS